MKYKTGFFSLDNTFYEDGTVEQDEFLSQPITEDEENTLLGYMKQIWQNKGDE